MHFLRSAEAHGIHVDVDGSLDTSSAIVKHASPVLEGIIDQGIRWDCNYGLVPVTDLDGSQGDFHHKSVCTILRHCDPVVGTKHIIGNQLDTGNKALDCILKHQHKYCCTGSQSGQQ